VGDLVYRFGPFRLEVAERRLSCGDEVVSLRSKIFDTLRVLVENHHRLVRKRELMNAVWPDQIVAENNLDQNISAIRKLLGERGGGMKFLETIPRHGYRFIAPVETVVAAVAPASFVANGSACLIEREEQLSMLETALAAADAGARQIIFITGEPGIGKTALVRAFAAKIEARRQISVTCGECQDHLGGGEPYLPVLEAFGRLARKDGGGCIDILKRHAPSWLTQLPSAVAVNPAPPMLGVTAERMLREMAEAMEVLTASRPLVLILEDLHWADYSTIDLVARIAQRTEPARLVVICTYRASELRARAHPLEPMVHQLKVRGCCQEIALTVLTAGGVAEYVQARLGDLLPRELAARLHARTGGNPLFVTAVVNSWIANGSVRRTNADWILAAGSDNLSFRVPDDLRQLLERQFMDLDPVDQEIVEAASVAGMNFYPPALAYALERSSGETENRCAALSARARFLTAAGAEEWPDGTVCQCYQFLHNIHRDVVYDRIPAGKRASLHERIADRLELAYGDRSHEIAAQLAEHFTKARKAARAIHYRKLAAGRSLAGSAHQDAAAHLTAALEMIGRLPAGVERVRCEMEILSLLAPTLVAIRGFADPQAEYAFRRAYDLSAQLNDIGASCPVVFGLAVMLEVRGRYPDAQRLIERHFPEQKRSGTFLLEGRNLLACSRFHQGAFHDALEHGEMGARAWSPDRHSEFGAALAEDPGIDCRTWAALSLWFLGFPDRALAEGRLAVSLADDPSRLYSLASARTQLAMLHQLRQEENATLDGATQAVEIAARQGFPYRRAVALVMRGWALARLGQDAEGVRQLQEGIDGCDAAGAELDRPYHLALLAEAHLLAARPHEAAAALDAALAQASATTGFFYSAELYRLRGVVAAACGDGPEAAEDWASRALAGAREQHAL
jgi:DNA-binding winged helix-turn-helix (wHTH) protein